VVDSIATFPYAITEIVTSHTREEFAQNAFESAKLDNQVEILLSE
jgi:hypothetical protein